MTMRLRTLPRFAHLATVGRRVVRRHPMTAAVAALTAAVSIPALWWSPLVAALEQNPPLTFHGQWWRLVSPLLVQRYGVAQFVFNMLGTLAVGAAVERRYGPWRWLAVYLAAGVASISATSVWFPQWVDSGSSTGVAGLIGAMTVALVVDRELPHWTAMLYAVFFCAYLTLSAFGGRFLAVAVTLVIAAVFLADRSLLAGRWLRIGTAGVVVASAAALLAIGDIHGVGLAAGLIAGAVLRPAERSAVIAEARSSRTRSISARK